MRHVTHWLVIVGLLAGGWGCATTKDLPGGPADYPHAAYSWNMTAYDAIMHSDTGAATFSHYLELLERRGYKKQVRIIAPHGWGESVIEPLWLPVIRAKGWKALVIVAQQSSEASDRPAALAWVHHLVTTWRDVLVGVQPANEPYQDFEGWNHADYLAWHRAVSAEVRAVGLPVVTGDYGQGHHGPLAFYAQAGLEWSTDVDVLSLHVTGELDSGKLRDLLQHSPQGKPIWITEGDWAQRTVIPAVESFVYTCIGAGGQYAGSSSLNRCPAMEGK